MKIRNCRLWVLVAVIGTWGSTHVNAQGVDSSTEQLVKIAHVTPLSNRFLREIAEEGNNAAAMAIADLNAREIKVDGKKLRFQSINIDDKADVSTAIEVAKNICQGGFSGVVGHLNSGTTIKAAPYYQQCAIPHITVSATNPLITERGYKTSFRLIGNDADLGQVLGYVATAETKTLRIAVLHDRTFYGELIAANFVKGVTKSGGQIVWSDSVPEYAPSPTAVVQRLKDTNIDLLFYGGMDAIAGKFLKEMAYQQVRNVKLMGGDGICSDDLPKIAGSAEAAEVVLCGEGGAPVELLPGGIAFATRYRNEFQKDVKTYASQTYDAFMAFASAIEMANSTNPSKYLEFLSKVKFDGVSGSIAFDSKGDLSNPVFTVFTYKAGKKVPQKLYHLSYIQ